MTNNLDDLAHLYDKQLLKILQEGRQTLTREGEVIRVEATAADLNVIRQRLKDCGITSTASVDSPVANIVEEWRKRGLNIPEMDATEDVAIA